MPGLAQASASGRDGKQCARSKDDIQVWEPLDYYHGSLRWIDVSMGHPEIIDEVTGYGL